MDEKGNNQTFIIAGIVIALIGGGLFYMNASKGDPPTQSCMLTATGVTLIATGLARGQNASAIIAAAGTTLGAAACEAAVNELVDDPKAPIPVKVQIGPGEVRPIDVTADSFIPPSAARPKTCNDWIVEEWKIDCIFGRLSPPPF